MTKGAGTFLSVNHAPSGQALAGQAMSLALDPKPLVDAINALTVAVKAVKQEIRIDLPAMSPVIQASPVPVSVTVPDLPPNPPVSITIPDFPKIPEYPVIKVPRFFVAAVCAAIVVSNVVANVVADLLRHVHF